jgi:hypothetical protein
MIAQALLSIHISRHPGHSSHPNWSVESNLAGRSSSRRQLWFTIRRIRLPGLVDDVMEGIQTFARII